MQHIHTHTQKPTNRLRQTMARNRVARVSETSRHGDASC